MAKQYAQTRLGRVSAFTAGFLLALCGTFSVPSLTSSAEPVSNESISLAVLEEQSLLQAASESSVDISIVEKRELLQQALVAANNINDSRFRQTAWADIADAYVAIGDYDQAKQLLDQVSTELVVDTDRILISSIRAYLDRTGQLATTYAAMGDMETAEGLLLPVIALISSKEAMEAAKGDAVTDEHIGLIRSEAIEELAKVYGDIGGEVGGVPIAETGLSSLMRLVNDTLGNDTIAWGYQKDISLGKIAAAYAHLSDLAIAQQGLDQVAGLMEDTEISQIVLANAYVEIGNDDAAHQLLASITPSLMNDAGRVDAYSLIRVAKAYGSMGDGQLAESQLGELLSMAEMIEEPYVAIQVFSAIALAYQTLGNVDQARQVVDLASPFASVAVEQGDFSLRALPVLFSTYEQLGLLEQQQDIAVQLYTKFVDAESAEQKFSLSYVMYQLYPQVADDFAPTYFEALIEEARARPVPTESLSRAVNAAMSRGEADRAIQLIDEISQDTARSLREDIDPGFPEWEIYKIRSVYLPANNVALARRELQALTVLASNGLEDLSSDAVQSFIANSYLSLATEDAVLFSFR
ncbi:MAG: hypothetical protein AAF810_27510 [Cyanobacteria bacterium P01_D01_bin.36]